MRKADKLDIIYESVSNLIPYAQNAKEHTKEQIEQIKESIKEFGFNDPVGVDENNLIIEGHGRYIAALELGIETIPIFHIDGLSEEEKKAYMLVHNETTMNSGFDIDLLEDELERITDIDMEKYSFRDVPDSFFDENAVHIKNPGMIIATVSPCDYEKVKNFLDENLIEYKEKNVR